MGKQNNAERIMLAAMSVLLIFAGGLPAAAMLIFPNAFPDETMQKTVFFGGVALCSLGLLCFTACIVKINLVKKARRASLEALQRQKSLEMQHRPDEQRYIPDDRTQQKYYLGEKQPLDEKFAEIAKMDRTQFVLYVARLFENKGYGVRFTPVLDNYGIDILVSRGGSVNAVCCILTKGVLGEKDIAFAASGRNHYRTNGIVVLTNGYFDRTATELARKEKMVLVDKNILIEEFLK